MSTVGIDHIAMPTANAERLIEFYKRLGFTINDEDAWRAGEANAFSSRWETQRSTSIRRGTPRAFGVRRQSQGLPTYASCGTVRQKSADGWLRKRELRSSPVPDPGGARFNIGTPSASMRATPTRTCSSG